MTHMLNKTNVPQNVSGGATDGWSHRGDIRFELPELNTWRMFNKSVSADGVLHMVRTWESKGYRLGCITIDDGWQRNGLMGEWIPCPDRFPDPKGTVDALHDAGYAVRLWMAPCQIHPGTEAFDKHWPNNLMQSSKGTPSFYVGLGTYTLDLRKPEAEEHIFNSVVKMAKEWGVDGFKVDFPPFYRPYDEYYEQRDYDLPDEDAQSMVGRFYQIVREALDSVRPGLRVEAYPKCPGAAPYIDDCICGDLVGKSRAWPILLDHARKMREFIGDEKIVPWLEMVWGEGGNFPSSDPAWHNGFIEYIAASINFEMKIEHSFPPFDYANAEQIRILTNLYGPRNSAVKVLHAGRVLFSLPELREHGAVINNKTRFIVAPSEDTTVELPTAELHSDALGWKARNVGTDSSMPLRGRNEFWAGNINKCRVELDAKAGQVYELWYAGETTDYFLNLYREHSKNGNALPPSMAQADAD